MASVERGVDSHEGESLVRRGASARRRSARLRLTGWLLLAFFAGSAFAAALAIAIEAESGSYALAALIVAAATAAAIAWLAGLRASHVLRRLESQRTQRRAAQPEPRPRPDDQRIADLSHDLRNPLAVALGYSEMAGDADLPDEERASALARVKRSIWELTQMVENVLESSAHDAGALELAPEAIEVSTLFDELGSSARILARARPLRVETAYEPGLFVTADRQRLVRVLSNLIGNAIKYTEHGEIALHATRAEDRVVFEVSDTGPGIAPEELSLIFARYQQLSKTGRGGVGLGLAISQMLTERMGGVLSVESTPGLGSRFRVALPLAHDARETRIHPRAA
jgi:signal transduction histidine kinase